MKRFLCGMLAVMMLAGCSHVPVSGRSVEGDMFTGVKKKEPAEAEKVTETTVAKTTVAETTAEETEATIEETETAVNAPVEYNVDMSVEHNLLGDNLVDIVYSSQQGNVMMSPLSLNMALCLLREGAADDSESAKAVEGYLGTDYREFAQKYLEYVNEYMSMSDELAEEYKQEYGYSNVLEIANSVWVSDKYTIAPDYQKGVQEKYGATANKFSGDDPVGSSEKINAWCDEKTHSLIKKIIDENSITPDLVAVLMNSVYFESPWSEKWGTMSGEFTGFDGVAKETEMLTDTLGSYYENDKAIAFSKPYMNGTSFVGILPKADGDFKLADLDIEGLIKTRTTKYDVYAKMPKLNFDTTADKCLTDYLYASGLAPVFADSLDFIGMTEEKEVISVDAIIQKTKIELDENGTKAAAVTAIMMDTLSMAPEERKSKEVYLDRPFAFLIYDASNDVVLFAGKVVSVE